MQELYIIRHCQAEGQEPNAPLTILGQEQADRLAAQFDTIPLDVIISSPYLRAIQTIQPLAEKKKLVIHQDERLIERVLCGTSEPNWRDMLQHTYNDMELCYAGGESSRQATERVLGVIEQWKNSDHTCAAIISHGNLISLLLRAYDGRTRFREWERLTNPDVYRLSLDAMPPSIERVFV
ncbi:histidine phosphatase family protein [Paenibacillus sp. WLX2291]|uniref:histidine phosphatase family protein n=1 Tax=Paenibacillus sp. WLX2291 TaxID=3296934 RepID=UPI003983EEFA